MSQRHRRDRTQRLIACVRETIVRHDLIKEGEHIVVAASGGPDSTCLAAVLHQCIATWNLTLHLAHVNYGTRGNESEADEHFVRKLGQDLHLPVSIERVTSEDLAGPPQGSFQARARTARYRFLVRVAEQCGAQKIATGHTADDQAETVLMRLLRGAGLTGLGGIPVQRHHRIVRPLMALTRRDVLAYLDAKHLAFRTDATNHETVYVRNRVRHHLLPLLGTYNPRIRRSLTQLAELASEDEKVLRAMTQRVLEDLRVPASDRQDVARIQFSRSRFLDLPRSLQRRCLREAVARINGHTRRLTFTHIETAIAFIAEDREPSATFEFVGLAARHPHRDVIVMAAASAGASPTSWEPQQLSVPDEIRLQTVGCRIRAWWGASFEDKPAAIGGSTGAHDPMIAVFDADTFALPLTIRAWRDGDVFCPLGMGGKRKKLQDYFVDAKVPKRMRGRIPLIVAPEGILWISGYRQDDRFRCRATTQRRCFVRLMREHR